MAISGELSTQLRELAAGLDLDPEFLHDALAGLVTHVQRSVPSYCGLQLRLHDHGWPVTLTDVVDAGRLPAASSLRISLDAIAGGGAQGDGHVLLFAGTPGAFVDLAADLGFALGVPVSTADPTHPTQPGPIELDGGSLPVDAVSGLSGLAEISVINQAVGRLLDRGHPPEEAHDLIRSGAASAGIAAHLFAARLLLPDDPHGGPGVRR